MTSAGSQTEGRRGRAWLTRILTWGATAAVVGATVLLALVAAGEAPRPSGPTSPKLVNVETESIAPREHVEALTLPARLVADRRAAIRTELAGRIEAWLVEDGAEVAPDQVVAVLDGKALAARIAELEADRDMESARAAVAAAHLEAARVSRRQAESEVEAFDVERAAAVAELRFREKELARIASLTSSSAMSRADLDSSEHAVALARIELQKVDEDTARSRLAVEAAAAEVSRSEAALAEARTRIAVVERRIDAVGEIVTRNRLTSPIAGRLERRLYERGEVVQAGDVLARVYDLGHVRAVVDVPDRYVAFLDATPAMGRLLESAFPGAVPRLRAEIVIAGPPRLSGPGEQGFRLEATIARIAQASDPASNTFEVELRAPNPGRALREGILVEARIEFLVHPEAILIPIRAIQVTDAGPRVLVVEASGGASIARVRDIEPITIDGTLVMVRGPLRAGDRLLVAGGRGVTDGEEVRVVVADGVVVARPGPTSSEP